MCGMQVGLHVTSVSSPVGAAHPRPNGRIQTLAARAHQAVSAQHRNVLVTKSCLVIRAPARGPRQSAPLARSGSPVGRRLGARRRRRLNNGWEQLLEGVVALRCCVGGCVHHRHCIASAPAPAITSISVSRVGRSECIHNLAHTVVQPRSP